ncbi:hypothetical protein ACJJTC_015768 [Scirpophaga incertulas]
MVCHGPDPPEYEQNDLVSPSRYGMMIINGNGEDSDDERQDYFGYEPLPQGPDAVHTDQEISDDDPEVDVTSIPHDVPPIVTMDTSLTCEVWNTPNRSESIEMDNNRVQQVMSAMANFELPTASFPDWAQSVSEEQWKQTLKDRIENLKGKTV